MINMKDIYWLAGLLEGEGSFYTSLEKTREERWKPILRIGIGLGMTDKDVVERAAKLLDVNINVSKITARRGHKPMYHLCLSKRVKTMGWMMTLYPLMGERRQTQIRKCLDAWKEHKNQRNPKENPYFTCGHPRTTGFHSDGSCKQCRKLYMKEYHLRSVEIDPGYLKRRSQAGKIWREEFKIKHGIPYSTWRNHKQKALGENKCLN